MTIKVPLDDQQIEAFKRHGKIGAWGYLPNGTPVEVSVVEECPCGHIGGNYPCELGQAGEGCGS